MRSLRHLLCWNLLAFGNAKGTVQSAGMFDGACDPMTGLTAGSVTYFPRAPTKAPPPETSPLP